MKIREVMNPQMVDIMEEDSIFVASGLMKQHGVRHLAVTDDDSRVVGIISDRDVLKGLSEVSNTDEAMPAVKTYMTRSPVCCQPDDNLQVAIDKMLELDFHCVPVVDEAGRLHGVITSRDVLNLYERQGKPVSALEL